MTHRTLITTAAASLLSTIMISTGVNAAINSTPENEMKQKCYGIAKAGQNDCANLAGTHTCAGQSKIDGDKGEWKFVPEGTCNTINGLTEVEAKIAIKNHKISK